MRDSPRAQEHEYTRYDALVGASFVMQGVHRGGAGTDDFGLRLEVGAGLLQPVEVVMILLYTVPVVWADLDELCEGFLLQRAVK